MCSNAPRVLVFEDYDALIDVYGESFRDVGVDVVIVQTEAEGLRELELHADTLQAVVVDCNLKEVGRPVPHTLRAVTRACELKIPHVIVNSASPGNERTKLLLPGVVQTRNKDELVPFVMARLAA